MKMTIEEEPRMLVLQNFEAHAASGREQIEEMRRGTATYKGVPIKFGIFRKMPEEPSFDPVRYRLTPGVRKAALERLNAEWKMNNKGE
jgi:tRNA (guanine-N7-)-methyltransferase